VLGMELMCKGEVKSQAGGGGWGSRGSRWKLEHKGGVQRVPREGIFCAIVRTVCTDLRDPLGNPDAVMWWRIPTIYHDLLRQYSSYLFILLGWSSISVASLMMRSDHLDMAVWYSRARCPKLITVPCHGWLVWMFLTDMTLVFLQPGVNGPARLPILGLTAPIGIASSVAGHSWLNEGT
jgi:hypothetical protein